MIENAPDSWTLDALAALVMADLQERALLAAQRDGRVAGAPDGRTIRYYQTLGLLDRPRMVGREARYGRRHRLQLVAIKALQSRAVPLAGIQARLHGRNDEALRALVDDLATAAAATRTLMAAPAQATPAPPRPPAVAHRLEVTVRPGVRLVVDAEWAAPTDITGLQEAIAAALAVLQRAREAGDGGR